MPTLSLKKSATAAVLLFWSTLVWSHGTAPLPAIDARAIQFPDTADYQTLVVDLHTHSVFSDGHVWPKIRVEEALRDGLDGLAITEHLEYQPHRADIPHPDRNRAVAEARSAAAESNLLIISGSEITREPPAGHMNAVFLTDANQLLRVDTPPQDTSDAIAYYTEAGKWPAQSAVDAANEQGAFVFWNHPYWTAQAPDGIARMNAFHAANIETGKLHGIEIANGQDYSEEAHQLALKHNLTLIGVSDIHDLIDWDHPPQNGEHRPVTLVLADQRNEDAIREALFARRTVVWFRNLLIGRPAELMPLLQASITTTAARYLPQTEVVEVELANHSDAAFVLRNMSAHTFMHSGDRIELPPHETTRIMVKPGQVQSVLDLQFSVENALSAPKTHPQLSLVVDVEGASSDTGAN